jgi:dethiobiotin synthetase
VAGKILFITGTDTGVGKTLLTALLLHHLREAGHDALAMKPFCSGGRGDVELLQALQPGLLPDREMNPFYYPEPVAPVAARGGRNVPLGRAAAAIRRVGDRCDILLVEGSGGLLVPLGRGYLVADLIRRLWCGVIVVARDRLGTINHTLLTVRVLEGMGVEPAAVALMSMEGGDPSVRTNERVLAGLLGRIPLVRVANVGRSASRQNGVKKGVKLVANALARLVKAAKIE